MITRVEISNYRSIGEKVELRLGKLTALVGPNGSGKSNFADALRFVSDALRNGLETAISKRHGFAAIRRWSAGMSHDISIQVDIANGDIDRGTYLVEIGASKADEYRVKREFAQYRTTVKLENCRDEDGIDILPSEPIDFEACFDSSFEVIDGVWKSGPDGFKPKVDTTGLVLPILASTIRFGGLADVLRNISIYSIFPDTLREPQKPDPVKPMTEHGGNWCSILKQMKDEGWGPDLKAALGYVTGDIDDVRVRQVGGYLVTEFRHGKSSHSGGKPRSKWFDAAQESDGTLRVAGIITALLQMPALTLIGIEEPELTVHPGAIPLLYDFLKEASTRGQVLITTHSPDLLSLLDPDEIRVIERLDGVTTSSEIEESQRELVRDRLFTIGELMRIEGIRPAIPQHSAMEGR